ncbi:30S ribosomal protein S2 [Candidatus Uhrbacteria bacterium CG_4_10_14_0_2_um_filter_41_7]|uniref:Small ribosomal subunit protein uS2 n=1 Tax=Candidatus Uhrbacteria bacterium CG_4_9_14_3_um_filter_41_35 TaxID=1975034 RepID=A0A2M7XFN0_9BACT|nr:MAG: 30S ribosomal protein S2 [Candidatus Uhrbacteria bacterium CG11_big_fil_rev_8_21_14_0_20_41_9]PIZ55281.1 MAG: 30S ribosomal protein S2 [Candidatus Uhrbacteria bacterium CG_4_10_14_0_2_um_filter_41_7]PJA46684.1 MAG: 30S ribosomal protein S2 [Candidatus Uhrbacteria bacterium CG_4_9_14_3_um_filter_41_35]
MPKMPTLEEMLKAGVHFGHRTSRWHPKMKPFIFGSRGGVHIIDVEQTQKMLEEALAYASGIVSRGGNVVLIGTKPQIQDLIQKSAEEAGAPYVNTRWLGGTFTNFPEIQKLIKNYLGLIDQRTKGELKKYTKLEQLQFDRKIEELEGKIGGISELKKLPEAIFVLDVRNDKTAIVEAKKRGIKVIGVCDTNVNPTEVDYVIPANDDSIASLRMIAKLMSQALLEGKANKKAVETAVKEKADKKEEVAVAKASQETVEDLDEAMKDQLVKEASESKK